MSDTTLQYKTMLDASGFASGAQQINSQLGMMGIQTSAANANLGGLGTVLGTLANPLTAVAFGITAVGGALVSSVQSAAAWESAMVGVAKTTGLSGPALEGLSSQLLEMSTNMPVAAADLANIAQVGGSLGIATDQLAGFTEVAAKMGVGFEMSAEQAATSGAKILNAFGQEMDTANLEKLGSVVNTMGDSFAATEPQVLDFLNRASFLNTTMGQSIPQVAALGTTLISAGMEAEVASTGIKSALNMLTSTTSKTGGMDNWAKLLGVSVDELKGKIAGDLNSTLIETADKIAAMEDPTERFQAAVAAAGSEGAPALLKLAGSAEDYAKALGLSTSEWENAQSLQRTYDAQMESVDSKWTIFTNTLKMAATSVGTVLLPAVGGLLDLLTAVAKVGMEGFGFIGDLASGAAAVAETALGGGSMADIDSAFLNALGIKTGDEVAAGVKNSEKLKKSAAEALETPEAKAAMAESAKGSAEEWSKAWLEEIEKEQAGREIAKILARQGNEELTRNKGNVNGSVDTTLENGLKIHVAYQGNDASIMSRLFINGEQIGDEVYGANREKSIRKLLEGYEYNQGNIFDLTSKPGQAELWRIKNNVEIENLWKVGGTKESWTKFMHENEELAKTAGSDIMMALYEAEYKVMDSENPTLQESLGNVMKSLAEPGSVPYDILNLSVGHLLDADVISPMWADTLLESGKQAAEKAGKSFAEAIGVKLEDAMKDFDWSVVFNPDFMTNPEKYGVNDILKLAENGFQPQAIDMATSALNLYNSGLGKNQQLAADVLREYQEIARITPLMFSGAQLMALMSWDGTLEHAGKTLKDFLDASEDTTKELDRQSVGYNNLQKAIGDCSECAISEFGAWQEAQDNLFQGSYIGPGGQSYLDWKTKELQAISDTQVAHAAANGGVLQATMHVTLDSSKAWQDAQKLVTDIAALKPVVTVTVNLQPNAYALQAAIINYVNQALAGLA